MPRINRGADTSVTLPSLPTEIFSVALPVSLCMFASSVAKQRVSAVFFAVTTLPAAFASSAPVTVGASNESFASARAALTPPSVTMRAASRMTVCLFTRR